MRSPSADAAVTTDVDFRIQYVNPAAERLLGIPEGAALDRRIGDVIHLVNPDTQRTAASLIMQSTVQTREDAIRSLTRLRIEELGAGNQEDAAVIFSTGRQHRFVRKQCRGIVSTRGDHTRSDGPGGGAGIIDLCA